MNFRKLAVSFCLAATVTFAPSMPGAQAQNISPNAGAMVFGEQENVALKGTATQSSTYAGMLASNAIDGGSVALDQTVAAKRSSMSHTAHSGTDVWWNLELDQDYIISQVVIFNRLDNYEMYAFRIRGFVLKVLDKDDQVVFTQTEDGTYADVDTPLSFVIDVNPFNTVGKKIRIELPAGEYLQLQEVMVFGVVPPAVVPWPCGEVGEVGGAADTVTIHFTTSSLPYSESSGKFLIVGYGYVPLECQEKGAECDITICGRNTLDIFTSSLDMWRFSITGHIGPLVHHFAHPTSGSQLFPTIMGGSGWDVFQSYQLVKTEIEKFIETDSFTSSDDVVMEERFILMTIYFGWGILDNNRRRSHHCSWKGVTCDSSWYVISLDLSNQGVTGPIPEAICGLVNLLRFTSNELTEFPVVISKLVNLEYLYLYGIKLSGPIPETIGNLVNLKVLGLGGQLTGPIPETIGNLVNLEYLNLEKNELTGPIPETIGNLVNLKELDLDWNELTGPIPETIGNLVNLKELYLNDNELSGPIPETIGNLVYLEYLYLLSNELTGPIPETIGNMVNMLGLLFDHNKLTGPIPEAIGNMVNMLGLNINDNELTGSIPETIGNLEHLRMVQLIDNQLTGPIPETIGNLVYLGYLHLEHNELTGTIPETMGNLVHLQRLGLEGNKLSGPIPEFFINMRFLKKLYLYGNELDPAPQSLRTFCGRGYLWCDFL